MEKKKSDINMDSLISSLGLEKDEDNLGYDGLSLNKYGEETKEKIEKNNEENFKKLLTALKPENKDDMNFLLEKYLDIRVYFNNPKKFLSPKSDIVGSTQVYQKLQQCDSKINKNDTSLYISGISMILSLLAAFGNESKVANMYIFAIFVVSIIVFTKSFINRKYLLVEEEKYRKKSIELYQQEKRKEEEKNQESEIEKLKNIVQKYSQINKVVFYYHNLKFINYDSKIKWIKENVIENESRFNTFGIDSSDFNTEVMNVKIEQMKLEREIVKKVKDKNLKEFEEEVLKTILE